MTAFLDAFKFFGLGGAMLMIIGAYVFSKDKLDFRNISFTIAFIIICLYLMLS